MACLPDIKILYILHPKDGHAYVGSLIMPAKDHPYQTQIADNYHPLKPYHL